MPTSPRLNWPYPSENQDPWWEKFKSFVEAVDQSFYTTREDKNFVLFGGGTVSFDASSGLLSWTDPLEGVAATTGYRWNIPTPTTGGSVTLQDGEFFYVELTRAPQSTQSLVAEKGSRIPVSDDALVIAQRLGTAVIFRNGAVVGDGQSVILFGPRIFTTISDVIGIAGQQDTDQTGWQDKGGLRYDPAAYFPGGSGITREIKFYAMLWTTDDTTPLAAEARLYNLTDGAEVSGSELSSDSLTPDMQVSGALTPGLGNFKSTVADYAVQLKLDDTFGSPGVSDRIFCVQAFIRTSWS
jgi:hypothetical protein